MMTKTYLNQILSKHLLTRETCDCSRLVVPLVHEPVRVNAEDGRVGSVDEGLQLLSDAGLLHLDLLALGYILPNADNAYNSAIDVPASSCVQQDFNAPAVLGIERKFEVGRFASLKCVIQNLFHTLLKFWGDEVLRLSQSANQSDFRSNAL